jgi:hypothetical protein
VDRGGCLCVYAENGDKTRAGERERLKDLCDKNIFVRSGEEKSPQAKYFLKNSTVRSGQHGNKFRDADMQNQKSPIIMEEVTDPVELAKARAQREQFDRNAAWLQAHAPEIYTKYRGKCICIAGEELFAADTAKEALALATEAHPEDEGRFVHYIPKEKVARIYANR